MKLGTKAKLSVAGVIVGVGFLYFMATNVVPKILVTMTKAAPATKISFGNSILIGKKILAGADGKDKCVINIFVMDDNNKGVAGKRVEVEVTNKAIGGGSAVVSMVNGLTDKDGNVVAEITSKTEGQYTVTTMVEGVALNRSLVVTFRN